MIALTKEKREELAKFAKATLNSLNGIEPEDPNQYDDCLSEYTQKCMKIALASLTAESKTVRLFGDYGEGELCWIECDPSEEGAQKMYPAPPVPEIKKDGYIGLQVSVDVSTCDDDAGHRYFGRVSTITESKGEVVLVVEEPEKNFTAPPLPEIKGYAEPHTQYSEGVVDGYNRCLAEIKRLNGLGGVICYLKF